MTRPDPQALPNPGNARGPILPWWRVPMVWLVIAGPALVVVAGFATLAIAASGADTVLRVQARAATAAPAMQARNHAATGHVPGVPAPAATPTTR